MLFSKREITYLNNSVDLKVLPLMSCNCRRLRKTLERQTEGIRIALPQEEVAEVEIIVFENQVDNGPL